MFFVDVEQCHTIRKFSHIWPIPSYSFLRTPLMVLFFCWKDNGF
jgi:hypothetical protein